MMRRLVFNESDKDVYLALLAGFRSGGWSLGPDNPKNERRDRRPGANGGEIVRGERAVWRALESIGRDRDWTDAEIDAYAFDKERQTGRAPTAEQVEADLAVVRRPRELAGPFPRTLDLAPDVYKRLASYLQEASWAVASEEGEKVLDLVDNAEAVSKC